MISASSWKGSEHCIRWIICLSDVASGVMGGRYGVDMDFMGCVIHSDAGDHWVNQRYWISIWLFLITASSWQNDNDTCRRVMLSYIFPKILIASDTDDRPCHQCMCVFVQRRSVLRGARALNALLKSFDFELESWRSEIRSCYLLRVVSSIHTM